MVLVGHFKKCDGRGVRMRVVHLTMAQACRSGDLRSGLRFPPKLCHPEPHPCLPVPQSPSLTGDQWGRPWLRSLLALTVV